MSSFLRFISRGICAAIGGYCGCTFTVAVGLLELLGDHFLSAEIENRRANRPIRHCPRHQFHGHIAQRMGHPRHHDGRRPTAEESAAELGDCGFDEILRGRHVGRWRTLIHTAHHLPRYERRNIDLIAFAAHLVVQRSRKDKIVCLRARVSR